MPPDDGRRRELAEIEALIAKAEAELVVLTRAGAAASRDRADADDALACLELWLKALRARRDGLLGKLGQVPVGPGQGRRH